MLETIGHNLAGAGKMLKPVLPRKKAKTPDAPKAKFPYFKFYPRDWLEATRNMTLEARGAYIDLLCIMWEMEGHLADNDKWISHQMHVSPRKWRSLKEGLVEQEKISISDGLIINERCLSELGQLMEQRKNISESSAKREQEKRETSVKLPGNIRETSVKLPGNIGENPQKANGNNEPDTTVVPLRALAIDLDSDKKKEEKKESPPPSVRMPLQHGGTKRDPFGLNRTMAKMREDVWFDGTQRIQVGNGFKAEMLELTGSEQRLRIELDRAAEWIGPNTPDTVLIAKVRGRLQTQMAEKLDRDERYQRAANAKKPENNLL